MTTISVFRVTPGGYAGDGHVHPAVVDAAREAASKARRDGGAADTFVARCGPSVALVAMHDRRPGHARTRALARRVLGAAVGTASQLGGHPIPAEGNGSIELEGAELEADGTVLALLSCRAPSGVFDAALARTFADPFSTPTLATDPALAAGFRIAGAAGRWTVPGQLNAFVRAVLSQGPVVRTVDCVATGSRAASVSFEEDPVLLVRCGAGFPSVTDVLESLAAADGRFMPVSTTDDGAPLRTPPRAIALGFEVSQARLVGPRDVFADATFDAARRAAMMIRRSGTRAPAGMLIAP